MTAQLVVALLLVPAVAAADEASLPGAPASSSSDHAVTVGVMAAGQWLPPTLSFLYGGGLHIETRGTFRVFGEGMLLYHETSMGNGVRELLGTAGVGLRIKKGVLRIGGSIIDITAGDKQYRSFTGMAGIGLLFGSGRGQMFALIDGYYIPGGALVQVSLGAGMGIP